MLGSQALFIPYDPFYVLPSNYNAGSNSIKAYFYQGKTVPKVINFGCNCLTQIVDLDWIDYNEKSRTFTISTKNISYAGNYSVLIV